MKNLKTKIKNLPESPGVYLFKDKKKQIIYIGKAVNLKKRVKSYFSNKKLEPKTLKLVSAISDLKIIKTDYEFEALLLEAKLVKQHQPKYNIDLKDNKRYLYIAIYRSPFPHINIVRRIELEENLYDWFGPYPSAYAAREVLRFIRRVFKGGLRH